MNSRTTKSFRDALRALSSEARKQAREAHEQFEDNPFSPGQFRGSECAEAHLVGSHYAQHSRARHPDRDEITWYWIGTHREYEKRKK